MATAIAPRPLADLEQDAIVAVEEEMARRAQGVKPWTTGDYINRIARVHAHYQWIRMTERGAAS